MKIKNNKELNKLFIIMTVLAIVTLGAGVQIGFELRDSIYDSVEAEQAADASKAIAADDSVLYKSLAPKLNILNTSGPVSMSYDITNLSSSELYVETATINAYNNADELIYTTDINIYKTYLPNEKDNIAFQIPQKADSIAKVEIVFE